jgi:hypothetical protein
VGAVTARGIGWALLALVIGASAGVGTAYATRPDPSSSGTARPVPAAAPSVPTDDPFAPDIDYAPLGEEVDSFVTYRMGTRLQTWEFDVPAGWVAYAVTRSGDEPISPDRIARYDEVRFRPEGEPLIGGYSLRVKAIDNHKSPLDELTVKESDIERMYDDVEVLEKDDEAIYLTFRAENDTLRYNFFRWFTAEEDVEATLEMSVAGREVDEPGLRARFDEFTERATPIEE